MKDLQFLDLIQLYTLFFQRSLIAAAKICLGSLPGGFLKGFKQLVLFIARFAYIHIRRWNATHRKCTLQDLREKLTFVIITVEFQYPFPESWFFAPQTSTGRPARRPLRGTQPRPPGKPPQNRRWR